LLYITKLEVTTLWVLGIPLGIKAELWMSHDYIENNLEQAFVLGVIGISLLLIALSAGTAIVIAWIFASAMMTIGIDGINDCDQGRGVYIWFALGIITVFPPRMEPQ